MTPADSLPEAAPESAEEVTVTVQGPAAEPERVIVFTPPEENTTSATSTSVYVPFAPEAAEEILAESNSDATAIVISAPASEAETSMERGLTWWQSSAALLIAALTALTPFSSRRDATKSRVRLNDQEP